MQEDLRKGQAAHCISKKKLDSKTLSKRLHSDSPERKKVRRKALFSHNMPRDPGKSHSCRKVRKPNTQTSKVGNLQWV